MSGHDPDVRFSGYPSDTWTTYGTSPPTLTGGGGLQQTTDSSGTAAYGTMSPGGPVDTKLEFSITTASTGVNTGTDRAFSLHINVNYNGGFGHFITLYELATGWEIDDGVTAQSVTLAESTTYSGYLQLLSGTATWSFLGKTGTLSVSPSTQVA